MYVKTLSFYAVLHLYFLTCLFVTQCSERNNPCAPARQRCSSEISDWFRSVSSCQFPFLQHFKLDSKLKNQNIMFPVQLTRLTGSEPWRGTAMAQTDAVQTSVTSWCWDWMLMCSCQPLHVGLFQGSCWGCRARRPVELSSTSSHHTNLRAGSTVNCVLMSHFHGWTELFL